MLSIFCEETGVSSGVSPEYFQQISLGTFKNASVILGFATRIGPSRGTKMLL